MSQVEFVPGWAHQLVDTKRRRSVRQVLIKTNGSAGVKGAYMHALTRHITCKPLVGARKRLLDQRWIRDPGLCVCVLPLSLRWSAVTHSDLQ